MGLDEIRPIVVRSHIAKIMVKGDPAKMKEETPHLLASQTYQTGFKEGKSTAIHASRLLAGGAREKEAEILSPSRPPKSM